MIRECGLISRPARAQHSRPCGWRQIYHWMLQVVVECKPLCLFGERYPLCEPSPFHFCASFHSCARCPEVLERFQLWPLRPLTHLHRRSYSSLAMGRTQGTLRRCGGSSRCRCARAVHGAALIPLAAPGLFPIIAPTLTRFSSLTQVIMQLERKGLTNYIALTDSPDLCEELHKRWPVAEDALSNRPSCAWSSQPYEAHNKSYHRGNKFDMWAMRYFIMSKIGAHTPLWWLRARPFVLTIMQRWRRACLGQCRTHVVRLCKPSFVVPRPPPAASSHS